MPRSAAQADHGTAPSSVESALGISGSLRVRSYGNVKHAHVVLRKVEEEEYTDDRGKCRTRGVFSLFAHKLINVKPGKELFLFLHPVDGELTERVVAFEADIRQVEMEESLSVKEKERETPKSEVTVVQPEQILPPKMRKMWARKPSMTAAPASPVLEFIVPAKVSVGIQAEPAVSTVATQASMPLQSSTIQTDTTVLLETHSRTFVSPKALEIRTVDVTRTVTDTPSVVSQTIPENGYFEDQTAYSSSADTRASTDASNDARRSYTPMEIESVATTPEYSPERIVLDFSPKIKAEPDLLSDAQHLGTIEELPSPLSTKDSIESQLASAVTLVETPYKDEPMVKSIEQFTPSLPTPLTNVTAAARRGPRQSRVLQAPTFVPALINPFSEEKLKEISELANALSRARDTVSAQNVSLQTNALGINTNLPIPAPMPTPSSSKVTLEDTPTSFNNLPSVTYHQSFPPTSHQQVYPAPSQYSQYTPSTPYNQNTPTSTSFSTATPTPTASHRPIPIPIPIPIPMTLPFAPPAPTAPASLRHRPAPIFVPALQQGLLSASPISTRKRAWSPPREAPPSEYKTERQSKKWKQIVKAEPKSPDLSILSLPTDTNGTWGTGATSPTNTPSYDNQTPSAEDWAMSKVHPDRLDNVLVKAEYSDPSLHVSGGIPPAVPSIFDLTESLSKQMPDEAAHLKLDLSLPPKPQPVPKASGRRVGGTTPLPVIRSAKIRNGREIGVRTIAFNSTGKLFAVICRDNTVRIWDNTSQTEIAKLSHSSTVVSVLWLDGDSAVASLGSNGVVSKWTMLGEGKWEWSKLVDSDDNDPTCLAYHRDRLAVANPRRGIKIWTNEDGRWKSVDKGVPRKDIITIQFINNGDALLCGSSDGTILHCSVPKCRVQPILNLKTKVYQIDVDSSQKFALVAEACGRAHIIDIDCPPDDRRMGCVVQDFSLRDADCYSGRRDHSFGAVFGNDGNSVLFGCVGGRVLVWDRKCGRIKHEMTHGNEVKVQAIACCDGEKGDKCIISATRQGKLTWWSLPKDTS